MSENIIDEVEKDKIQKKDLNKVLENISKSGLIKQQAELLDFLATRLAQSVIFSKDWVNHSKQALASRCWKQGRYKKSLALL